MNIKSQVIFNFKKNVFAYNETRNDHLSRLLKNIM